MDPSILKTVEDWDRGSGRRPTWGGKPLYWWCEREEAHLERQIQRTRQVMEQQMQGALATPAWMSRVDAILKLSLELDKVAEPPPTQKWLEGNRKFVQKTKWWYERETERLEKRINRMKHALEQHRNDEAQERKCEARSDHLRAERVRDVNMLIREYQDAPQLATDEYILDLARNHGKDLIARAKEIRQAFREFYERDSAFMELLRKEAPKSFQRIACYATREHRALGIALSLEAKSPPEVTEDEPQAEVIERCQEEIEILGG